MSTCSLPISQTYELEQYAYLIEAVLSTVSCATHPYGSKETLLEIGYIGLLEALERKMALPIPFEQYATMKIRSRMIHHLFAL
ncbi:MAG: hypothetical protein VX278_09605 [Myxococcota bacterium]|nr:hypothetical protein [Myxococcota bacterium]